MHSEKNLTVVGHPRQRRKTPIYLPTLINLRKIQVTQTFVFQMLRWLLFVVYFISNIS